MPISPPSWSDWNYKGNALTLELPRSDKRWMAVQRQPSRQKTKSLEKKGALPCRRMALAQRARFAKLRQDSEPPAPKPAKRKRKLSAAGRKAISEATKRRWAAVRAAR